MNDIPGTLARQPAARRATAADLLSAVSIIRRTVRRAARQASTQEPLPTAQSELLRLAAAQPRLTVAAAAQELRLAPNTVSTLVSRLTATGLLGRTRGEADGRTALLTVTPAGRSRIRQWRDLRAELTAAALGRLAPADQRTLAAAAPALRRLAEQIEADRLETT
ncbi:MAG TPA: MarR family transcriptional regulator [Streptosporangiaceae bacterium]